MNGMTFEFHGYRIVQGNSEWLAYQNGKLVAKADTDSDLLEMLS